ncbi:LacI family DNA-binding transcriptional regulator [Hymenobacter sp. BT770]|uniref:LacI family DNA-binding transcriptional regulator n=1 Tax=Hymenobacter sp. BT770 TaxID=2886942 RepID=UPI001D10C5E1|nr:LacI family DNA-binding transcriptional regulator [Hymenobacter sp. BT770]MCC3153223.1 LacI family transcriptional regulator [Hymenobacter sp. BT770]MDO3414218.1 LacI family DNA-binding transcriptional regulator [Hymenobacter sp. BT770]
MPPVNLKRLAQELNLSIASVSRALQDSHEVSSQTKERVRALATALNYQPHAYASSLRRNLSKTIGVVIPKVANHFFALAINGIEEVARQSGFQVLISLTHDDYAREVSIIQHMKGGRVDGLLMSVASGTEDFAHIKSLRESNIPIVFFDRVCAEVSTAKVTTNDYESAFQATEHLIQAGCRRIAHLLISNNLSIGQFRQQGYRDALLAHGCDVDPTLILHGVMDNEQNVALIRDLLLRRPDIDGVFASVERLAISTYRVCKELGRTIPDDIKVIGFSNLEAASMLDPPLSTVTQPAYDIGREAAKILLRALEKKKAILPSQSQVLKSELFQRQSTAAAPAR